MKPMLVIAIMTIAWSPFVIGQMANQKANSTQKALAEYRKDIDTLDRQIVSLLNKRAAIALEIGQIRQRDGTPPSSAQGRAEEVVRNAMDSSKESPRLARKDFITAEAPRRRGDSNYE